MRALPQVELADAADAKAILIDLAGRMRAGISWSRPRRVARPWIPMA